MAVIVQADPYQSLIRKIGYSVGLESVCRRATALTELYAEKRKLSFVNWSDLVVNEFGRDQDAIEHIADFFGQLHLLRLMGKRVTPLYGLEVLSILWRNLVQPIQRAKAIECVLTSYLIEADGDIFLNLLATSFNEESAATAIKGMIYRKRALLAPVIRHPSLRAKVFEIVSIKFQPTSKRNRPLKGSSKFSRRQEPLSDFKRKEPLSGKQESDVLISEDYLRKTIQTRKSWAKELGLFDSDQLTEAGRNLLNGMQNLGLYHQEGVYLFWPYQRDLTKLQLDSKQLQAPPLSEWNLLAAIAESRYGCPVDISVAPDASNHVLNMLKRFQILYREGNIELGSIRHHLPLYIAYPALVGTHVAKHEHVPPFPEILHEELKSPERRIAFVNIRETEGGISIRD